MEHMELQEFPELVWHHVESIVVMTAEALNGAGIPCILWGDCSISLWGTEVLKDTIDFVVPDDMVDKAFEVLRDVPRFPYRVVDCPEPSYCHDWNYGDPVARDLGNENFPSKRHLHYSKATDSVRHRFQIFGRSDMLFLPPMDKLPSDYSDTEAFAKALEPHYLLASDESRLASPDMFRHTGVYAAGRHPVVAPMPHVIVEAEMRLYARYVNTAWKDNWDTNLCTLGLERKSFVNPDLMNDPVLRDLFVRLRDGTFKDDEDFDALLAEALGEEPEVLVWPQGSPKVPSPSDFPPSRMDKFKSRR